MFKKLKDLKQKNMLMFFQIGTTNILKSVLNLKYLLKITVLLKYILIRILAIKITEYNAKNSSFKLATNFL
jgi:hypothetical protein